VLPAPDITPIAGFWRRLTAFVIDCLILSVPTLLLGLALFRWVAGLGPAGRLIGFVVALLYFGVLNSHFGGGQTLGKRLLGVRVIDRSGKLLSPIRSVLRFIVIAIPYFLNGLWFDVNAASAGPVEYLLGVLVVFVVFGGLGAIAYLFVFNRRTHQSLHDLAVGSFVVRGPAAAVPVDLSTPRLHLIVIGCWLGIALIVPGVGIWAVHEYGLRQSLEPVGQLQAAIRTRLGIRQVEVTIGRTNKAAGRGGTWTSYLEVDAQPDGQQQDLDTLLRSIARTVLDLRPELLGNQVLIVQVQRRLDLGIASWSEMRRAELDAAWREKNLALRNCLHPTTSEPELSAELESCSIFIEQKDQSPENLAFALSSRASIELSRGDHSKALADFDSALALNSNLDTAVVGRAITFVNSGQSERALPDFDHAIALHPSAPRLYVGRGDAFNNLKKYDQAIADYDQALALDPNDDEALNDRATALFAKGQYAEAIRGFDAALELATSPDPKVLGNRCSAKVMAGDIDSAFADCDAALKLEPGNADRLAGRGFINLKGERFAAAIADYDAALAVNPKDPFALYGRGVALLRLGQTAAGRADIVAAEQIEPNQRNLMLRLGISTPTLP
jgi:tetratricopeptide (TPR) repeat protein/uncharacterized RDD family membrane protein YckC